MASPYGIDFGGILSNVENIKSARQSRENNALLMNWKSEDREAARARGNALSGLRSKAAGGDKQAMTELVAFDPEEAQQMINAFKGMDDREREQAKSNIDMVGNIAAFVLQSDDPEQAYQMAKQNINPDVAAQMPEAYDPNFIQMQLARAREIDDLLANPEKMTVGSEDRLYKDGRLIETMTSSAERDRQNSRGNALIKNQGGAGGVKSADESLMYRQAGELLGGLFDQNGNLQNLDPSTRGKVQAIATEAAKIYQQGGVSRSQAVTQAARKQGLQVQDLSASGGNMDRNALLQQYSQ